MRVGSAQLVALAALIAPASGTAASFTVAETGRSYSTIGLAVSSIGNGTGTVLIAPGRYRDCAVQTLGRVKYVALRPGLAIFDGAACEGKAALVLRGLAATIDGLVFENLHIGDGNGAGVRLEHGSLRVRNSAFRDSDAGILSADDSAADVVVERTTFSGLGRCDPPRACAHSLYLGKYRSVTIRNCRFELGRGGHYVKSRARWIDVSDSVFDDRHGRNTNYMIDLPDGAGGRIAHNRFMQGRSKENHSALVAVAAETRTNMSRMLYVTDNEASLSNGTSWETSLVMAPSDAMTEVSRNTLSGGIREILELQQDTPSIRSRLGRAFEKIMADPYPRSGFINKFSQ